MYFLSLGLLLLASCSNPFQGRGPLIFRDLNQEQIDALRAREEARQRYLEDKKKTMEDIITDAQIGFEEIKLLLKEKCFDCHDANTKLPPYARAFPRINPLTKHQVEGLKALDFSKGYPLQAKGNPPQLSLLKSIRNTAIDRSMPLKSYRLVYRSRKITDDDEQRILAWVDPIIARLEDYQLKYETSNDPKKESLKILENKCFRCHANGNAKGGFGGMEDVPELLKSKYVDLKFPEKSSLYTEMETESMPPNKKEALTDKELFTIRDWLILESQNPN